MDSLRIVNLRSFADSGKVKVAPLTLLVGQNSSGKSTFARFFPLFRQTAEVLTREPLLWFGRFVDFGSVEEATSKFFPREPVGVDFEYQAEKSSLSRRRRGIIYPRLSTDGEQTTVTVSLRYMISEAQKRSYEFTLKFLGQEIWIEISDLYIRQLKINGTDFSSSLSTNEIIVTTWSSCFPNLTPRKSNSDGGGFERQLYAFVRNHTHGKSGEGRVERLTRALISAPIDSMLQSLREPSAGDSMWQRTTANWTRDSADYKRVRDLVLGARIAEIFQTAEAAFSARCSRVRYIAPIRASAERYYRQQGLALGEIDSQGQNVAMFLHNQSLSERQRFSSWMGEFFGFYIDTELSQGHISMVIREVDSVRSKLTFNLADTGFGFSQMIPVLMQIWINSRGRGHSQNPGGGMLFQLISIEQPELHLHPRLQAKLADVLLQTILVARSNGVDLRLVVETHSEQIINRVGKRIGDRTFPKEDVSVVLFEKVDLSAPTSVVQTGFDADGLLDKWPYGFFDSESA